MQSFRQRRRRSTTLTPAPSNGSPTPYGGGGPGSSPRKQLSGRLVGGGGNNGNGKNVVPRTVHVGGPAASASDRRRQQQPQPPVGGIAGTGTGSASTASCTSLAEAELDAGMRGSSSLGNLGGTAGGIDDGSRNSRRRRADVAHHVAPKAVRSAATMTGEGVGAGAGARGGASSTGGVAGPRRAMGKEAVAKDEGRAKKVLVRALSGLLMVGVFLLILYAGHVYICALVALVELLLFRELVKVRYNTFFHIIEDTIPMFRTTQWMWFGVAMFYAYSDFVVDIIKSNTELHHLLVYAQIQTPLAFLLYSGTFVLTIATMQTGHIKFQLNQLCWTIVVLCLTVGQLKYVMHNVYNGLFWFALPILLVVTNDIFAYVCGMLCGRKFIHRPFIALSPNKTWEGFIGGWIFTLVGSWYLSRFMAQFTWLTCPTNQFRLLPEKLSCDLDPIFHEASSIVNPQVFELLPTALVQIFPGIINICSVDGDPSDLTPCISGEVTHSHHHFELVLKDVYPVQIHALSLGMFASLVAPFGGFLASAIKRAYGIKDFDSIIPGHGGLMDRLDCQFLMALCTWVHYNAFVKMATVSVPKMIYMYNMMKESEREEFLDEITEMGVPVRGRG